MKAFKRGRRWLFVPVVLIGAIALAGCGGGTMAARDVAVAVLSQTRVSTSGFVRNDSACIATTLTHPWYRDSSGSMIPWLYEACWPLYPDRDRDTMKPDAPHDAPPRFAPAPDYDDDSVRIQPIEPIG